MDAIRLWGMRLGAVIALLIGLVALPAAVEAFASASHDRRAIAAIVLPLLFIATGIIAAIASSRRLTESAQLRAGAALMLVLSAVLFVFAYAIEVGA